MIDIQAAHQDYWKAQNLDVFNGRGWVAGEAAGGNQLAGVDPSSIQTWTQTLTVTLRAMKTTNVIAAGFASQPTHISSAVSAGASPGTWTTNTQLGPGDSYQVSVYDPHPTSGQLETAGQDYPDTLIGYRALFIPATAAGTELVFPTFGSHERLQSFGVPPQSHPVRLIKTSPYGRAYALAQRLARRSATPYDFVTSVMSYLSHGFSYNENTPVHQYPLESFLFNDKYGYCQQFAGAMALLLRMGGVPARVAVGFTNGSYNTGGHDYVVGDIDAHAWVEAWFPHYGWVRFDPTPAVAPARGGKLADRLRRPEPEAGRAGHSERARAGLGPDTVRSTAAKGHGGTSPLVWIIPLALLAVARGGAAGADPDHRRALRRRDAGRARTGAGAQRANDLRGRDARRARAALQDLAGCGRVHPHDPDGAVRRRRPALRPPTSGGRCGRSCAPGWGWAGCCAGCGRCRRAGGCPRFAGPAADPGPGRATRAPGRAPRSSPAGRGTCISPGSIRSSGAFGRKQRGTRVSPRSGFAGD